MKKALAGFLVFMLSISSVNPLAGYAQEVTTSIENSNYQEGEVIVRLEEANPEHYVTDNIKLIEQWTFTETTIEGNEVAYTLAHYSSNSYSTKQLIQIFKKLDTVTYAEPNYHYKTLEFNDPYSKQEWHIAPEQDGVTADIKINSIWDKIDELESLEENVIAVIDTGVDYSHPDLADSMWENKTSLPGKHGYDFINDDDDPMDDYGHGTHCAGIIAAQVNNGIGVTGLDRNTKIMALKYMDENGGGLTSKAISAYQYVIDAKKQGVNVVAINNSWGTDENPKALEDIIKAAGEMGILSICAAGNFAANLDITKSFPAGYESPYIIVVGASTPEDEIASFSNYGKFLVDVVAPGTGIFSTYHKDSYIPGISEKDKAIYTFEEDQIPLKGNQLSISEDTFYEGKKSLLWKSKKGTEGESYIEGDNKTKFSNELTLDVPFTDNDLWLGFQYKTKVSDSSSAICYIEASHDGSWSNLGAFLVEDTNFWNTKWFSIPENTTQVRFLLIGGEEGMELYFDQIGIGTTTGKYVYFQGTSMAAPMVTAEVSMLRRLYPEESVEKIRARVVGGVDRIKEGYVSSDGRINMEKAMTNPYPVMNQFQQVEEKIASITGFFFGDTEGSLTLNGVDRKILSWSDTEIKFKYADEFDGLADVILTRGTDKELSKQKLAIRDNRFAWKVETSLPYEITDACAAGYGESIYVFGGTSIDGSELYDILRYDTKKLTWEKVATLPEEQNMVQYSYATSAVTIGDSILYITFDYAYSVNGFYLFSPLDYSMKKLELQSTPEPRLLASYTVHNGCVYMVGGIPKGDAEGQNELAKDIWRLNEDFSGWEKVASLSTSRYSPIVASVEGKLIVTGGRTGDSDYLTETEILDGTTVTKGAPIPYTGIYEGNAIVGGEKELYLMNDGISFEEPGLIYHVDTDTWETSPYRIGFEPYLNMASVYHNETLYAIGGEINLRAVSDVQSFYIGEKVEPTITPAITTPEEQKPTNPPSSTNDKAEATNTSALWSIVGVILVGSILCGCIVWFMKKKK